MLGMLIEGEWKTGQLRQDEKGRFIRSKTTFHDWISSDGSSGFPAEAGRYHLYIS